MAVCSLSFRDVTIPLSSDQFEELRAVWYAIGSLNSLLRKTRDEPFVDVYDLLRPVELDFADTMFELEERFSKARKEVPDVS